MPRGTVLLLLLCVTGSAVIPIARRPSGHSGFLDHANRTAVANLTGHSASALETQVNLTGHSASALETEVARLARPLVRLVETQLEYELSDEPKVPKVDKLLLVLLCCLFGACGFDRCFMGNLCCGVIKGLTCGGFGVWALVDQAVVLVNAMGRYDSIDTVGFRASFYPPTIDLAQNVAFLIVILVTWIVAFKTLFLCCTTTGRGYATLVREKSIASCPSEVISKCRSLRLVSEKPTVQEVKRLFDPMDKDGSGWLDEKECTDGLLQLGCSEESVVRWVKAADVNSDGRIAFAEFVTAMQASD